MRTVSLRFAIVLIFGALIGSGHADPGKSLSELNAEVDQQLRDGRYADALPAAQQALALAQQSGPESPLVAMSLSRLARVYSAQSRYEEAEQLYKRSLAILTRSGEERSADSGHVLASLGKLNYDLGRMDKAKSFFERAFAILVVSLGRDHPDLVTLLNNLAAISLAQEDYPEALRDFERSRAIREKISGPAHASVGTALNNIAEVYRRQRQYAQAEDYYRRALAIYRTALGPGHANVAKALYNLAILHLEQKNWRTAADDWRQSNAIVANELTLGGARVSERLARNEATGMDDEYSGLVGFLKVAYRVAEESNQDRAALAAESFEIAQVVLDTKASASLALMTARHMSSGNLGGLIRERQDLINALQTVEEQLTQAVSLAPESGTTPTNTAVLRDQLLVIENTTKQIDERLAKEFPDYAALTNPRPLSIAGVQQLLRDDEALVLFADTLDWPPMPEETFVWVVTKSESRWVKSGLGTLQLQDRVHALRCGLDFDGEWLDKSTCATLFEQKDAPVGPRNLPFDLGRAHHLYTGLFGEVEDLIANKQLIIVASGPLTALPFHVLVTSNASEAWPANTADYAKADWLAKRHAISLLPSVASLKALRQLPASRARDPFIGFGNPLTLGAGGSDRRAWERPTCAQPNVLAKADVKATSRGMQQSTASYFKRGIADIVALRRAPPLPETVDELCEVASSLGAKPDAVHLGAQASEGAVKFLSQQGMLANSRVVHFATHGLLAGETESFAANKAEPALLLTPPDEASDDDDGLLTASEVAQLKLDADWVVMSACNTASGEKPGAEAFSGLARAFFYAGARSLLVSHWYVSSNAAVALTTGAFKELQMHPAIGRSEAMRRSMLALIAKGGASAHPANWAPFVLVGEGGASEASAQRSSMGKPASVWDWLSGTRSN